jgi:hypothetical protein
MFSVVRFQILLDDLLDFAHSYHPGRCHHSILHHFFGRVQVPERGSGDYEKFSKVDLSYYEKFLKDGSGDYDKFPKGGSGDYEKFPKGGSGEVPKRHFG